MMKKRIIAGVFVLLLILATAGFAYERKYKDWKCSACGMTITTAYGDFPETEECSASKSGRHRWVGGRVWSEEY
jgi:hypothetical protein